MSLCVPNESQIVLCILCNIHDKHILRTNAMQWERHMFVGTFKWQFIKQKKSSPCDTLQWKRLYKIVDNKPTFLVFPHTHWLMSLAVRLAVPKKTITTSFQRGQCQSGHKKTNKSCKTQLPFGFQSNVSSPREEWKKMATPNVRKRKIFSKQKLSIFQTDGASSSGDAFLLKTNRCHWKSIWKECIFLSKI